jgi:hypothetical protein
VPFNEIETTESPKESENPVVEGGTDIREECENLLRKIPNENLPKALEFLKTL